MEVLNERAVTHGNFVDGAEFEQMMKEVLRGSPNWSNMPPFQKSALEMICHKMARILTGDPYFLDSWRDLQGYSKLGFDFTSKMPNATDVVVTRKKVHE